MTDTPQAEWRDGDDDPWQEGWWVGGRLVSTEKGKPILHYQKAAESYRLLAADMDAIVAEKQRQADAEQAAKDEAEAEEWADLAYAAHWGESRVGRYDSHPHLEARWLAVGRAVVARLREQAQS